MGLSIDEFGRGYLRRVGRRYSLIDKPNPALPGSRPCIFWDEEGKGCSVYELRPKQCRTYPFWKEILASEDAWRKEADACGGIEPGGDRGRLYDRAEIEELKTYLRETEAGSGSPCCDSRGAAP